MKQVRDERAVCLVDTATLIISLKASVESHLQQAGTLEKKAVMYALTKAIEVVSKSLLSRSLPYETQDQLSSLIASKLGWA